MLGFIIFMSIGFLGMALFIAGTIFETKRHDDYYNKNYASKFNVGSKVILKTGSPPMVISKIYRYVNDTSIDGWMTKCYYYEQANLSIIEKEYPCAILKPYNLTGIE